MPDHVDWAARLVTAVLEQSAERTTELQLRSVQAVAPDAVELIFFVPGDVNPRGVALDASFVESASERVRSSTIDELAFDVITLGILEPRTIEDFTPPDNKGVRWLPAQQWLGD